MVRQPDQPVRDLGIVRRQFQLVAIVGLADAERLARQLIDDCFLSYCPMRRFA
jgi:hypothetical protein